MSRVTVRPVVSRDDLKAFIRLPHELYAQDPNWVPPLDFGRRRDPDAGPESVL